MVSNKPTRLMGFWIKLTEPKFGPLGHTIMIHSAIIL
jgi:hypothetical protein